MMVEQEQKRRAWEIKSDLERLATLLKLAEDSAAREDWDGVERSLIGLSQCLGQAIAKTMCEATLRRERAYRAKEVCCPECSGNKNWTIKECDVPGVSFEISDELRLVVVCCRCGGKDDTPCSWAMLDNPAEAWYYGDEYHVEQDGSGWVCKECWTDDGGR